MVFEFFVLGGFMFYALLAVVGTISYLFYRAEMGVGTGFTLLIGAVSLWLFGDINVFKWAYHNPGYLAIGAVAYMLVGVIWSFIKWFLFNKERAEKIQEARDEYLKSNKLPTLETMQVSTFKEDGFYGRQKVEKTAEEIASEKQRAYEQAVKNYNTSYYQHLDRLKLVDDRYYSHFDGPPVLKPKLTSHKDKIALWIGYWPFSVTWVLVDDVLCNLSRTLFRLLQSKYQSVTDSVFKDVDEKPLI